MIFTQPGNGAGPFLLEMRAHAYIYAVRRYPRIEIATAQTTEKAMRSLAAIGLILVLALVMQRLENPGFEARWRPVIDHPLSFHSIARQGFCFPGECAVG